MPVCGLYNCKPSPSHIQIKVFDVSFYHELILNYHLSLWLEFMVAHIPLEDIVSRFVYTLISVGGHIASLFIDELTSFNWKSHSKSQCFTVTDECFYTS